MPNIQTVCQTSFGKFNIKIDDNNINVGGKTLCVNIALHKDETSLCWLKTNEGGCELNGKDIRGNNTIKMTDLAFSLLRKYYPERGNIVTLLDDSGFSWTHKDSKIFKTNFLKGYLLLHQQTWYEGKFGAEMRNPDIYLAYKTKAVRNFNDPEKKPDVFDFRNKDVNEKLTPLYKNSRTWNEFINKLVKKYGNEKYKMMNDWYRHAIYVIFDGMDINQFWKLIYQKDLI